MQTLDNKLWTLSGPCWSASDWYGLLIMIGGVGCDFSQTALEVACEQGQDFLYHRQCTVTCCLQTSRYLSHNWKYSTTTSMPENCRPLQNTADHHRPAMKNADEMKNM